MSKNARSLYLAAVITLALSLAYPLRVSADDEIPGVEPTPAEEETTVTGEEVLTEAVSGEAQDPLGGESQAVENAAADETNSEAAQAGGETDAQTADAPTGEPSLTETVAALNEAGAILTDENGNIIPLATEAAEAALLAPDPIGCPPGVQPVTWGGTGAGCTVSYASIQSAIDDGTVAAGWTIYIDPGTFNENVVVNKSVTLQGSGMGVTIIHPAISGPVCAPGSICPGGSNVILVRADNVAIRDLTVDGNNPALTSGVFSNGVDVDARNGIITDHTDAGLGVIDGLTVYNVEVENIYLRGIYASDGGTFDIHDNVIDNVAGEYASIALFNVGGSGVFSNNQVSDSNDGIAANWSTGTQFLNNTVTNSGSGIHTDNAQAADVISGNSVFNGPANSYGIFVFAPYDAVTVSNNTITNVDVGLTLSGNGWGDSLNTIAFSNNEVTTNVIGAYVTTDVWGYFFGDTSASFTGNVFTGGDYGFYLESNGAGEYYPSYDCSGAGGACVLDVTGSGNTIAGQNLFAATIAEGQPNWVNGNPSYYGVYDIDLRGNWWGDASGPNDPSPVPDSCGITLDNPTGLGGDVSKCILYDLWLASDPFNLPGGGGGPDGDPDSDPGNPSPPPIVFFTGGIPAFAGGPGSSGELFPISCDLDEVTLTIGAIKVTLIGLCGYEATLELLDAASVQPSLPNGETFLQGVRIMLLKDGVQVNALPADAHIVVSFPAATGSPMSWNGSWAELPGQVIGGRIKVEAGPGVFILVSK